MIDGAFFISATGWTAVERNESHAGGVQDVWGNVSGTVARASGLVRISAGGAADRGPFSLRTLQPRLKPIRPSARLPSWRMQSVRPPGAGITSLLL